VKHKYPEYGNSLLVTKFDRLINPEDCYLWEMIRGPMRDIYEANTVLVAVDNDGIKIHVEKNRYSSVSESALVKELMAEYPSMKIHDPKFWHFSEKEKQKAFLSIEDDAEAVHFKLKYG
jgi:hypothetical protein